MTKKKDENELAKSIIDTIIGETESENWCGTLEPKKAKAGRIGGKKRAANLTTEERSESARKAAQSRWNKSES
jgi:hypothetical protein